MKIGTHTAKVKLAALCRSRNNSDYIGVIFEITDGECAGEQINGRLFWTEKTQENTRKALAAMGWEGKVDNEGNLQGLKNAVPIGVAEDTYEGKTSLKVDWVVSPPVGINAKDRLSLRDAKGMLDDMRRGLGKPTPNGRQATPPPGASDAWEPPIENDDPNF